MTKHLKVTKPSTVKQLYQLLYDTGRILAANDITYVAVGGTLLGAIRNKGIIPWDDDTDIGIMKQDTRKFLKLKPTFKKCGYSIVKTWFGYKIFITKHKHISGFDYSYPFLDVFFLATERNGNVKYASKAVRDEWPKDYWKKAEFLPLQYVPMGDFLVPVPYNPKPSLTRTYGGDWSTHGYREYDHAKEEAVERKKVRLTKKDKEPAQPTKVTRRTCISGIGLDKDGLKKRIGVRKASGKCSKTAAKGCDMCVDNESIVNFVINCDVHQKRIKKFRKYAKAAHLRACREVCVNGKAFTKDLICNMVSQGLVSRGADMTPIEVSIFFSHFNVWQRLIDSCKEYALVFEDDAEVHKDFKKMLRKTLKALKAADKKFDILYLWNGNWADTEDDAKEILRVSKKIDVMQEKAEFNAGAVAYLISSDYAKRLLKRAFPIKEPVDIYMGDEGVRGRTKALSTRMKYNEKKDCYLSPFFRGTKWICGGEEGTGQTTQDYKANTVDSLGCRGKKRSTRRKKSRKKATGRKCKYGRLKTPVRTARGGMRHCKLR